MIEKISTISVPENVANLSRQLERLDKEHERMEFLSTIKSLSRYALLAGSALSVLAAVTTAAGLLPISSLAITITSILTVPTTTICLATNLLSTKEDEPKRKDIFEQIGLLERKIYEEKEKMPIKNFDMFLESLVTAKNPPLTTIKQMESHKNGAKSTNRELAK